MSWASAWAIQFLAACSTFPSVYTSSATNCSTTGTLVALLGFFGAGAAPSSSPEGDGGAECGTDRGERSWPASVRSSDRVRWRLRCRPLSPVVPLSGLLPLVRPRCPLRESESGSTSWYSSELELSSCHSSRSFFSSAQLAVPRPVPPTSPRSRALPSANLAPVSLTVCFHRAAPPVPRGLVEA